MPSGRICALVLIAFSAGCRKDEPTPAGDSAFAALQERGKTAMGVDQYASAHVFEPLPDGGRIVLQMKEADPAGDSVIRAHMRTIAVSFGAGDFAIPGRVHAVGEVPGTAVMSRLRDEISYEARDVERGGEVRLASRNPDAVRAIHEFLAFQRKDHRTGMHSSSIAEGRKWVQARR